MKRWDKEETKLLKIWIEQGILYKNIGLELSRSMQAVKHKAMTLGLKSKNVTCLKNQKEYKLELPKDIQVLEEYIGANTKILHKHMICGHEWKVKPSSILNRKDTGCPHCCINSVKTTEEYKKQLPKNIVLLGIYRDAKTKILHKCLICSKKWEVRPTHILYGSGCPVCNGSGFNLELKGTTYLIYFPTIDVYKVGVSNNYKSRMKAFGYTPEIVMLRHFNIGIEALNLEKEYLKNVKPYLLNTGKLHSGNTETFRYV